MHNDDSLSHIIIQAIIKPDHIAWSSVRSCPLQSADKRLAYSQPLLSGDKLNGTDSGSSDSIMSQLICIPRAQTTIELEARDLP